MCEFYSDRDMNEWLDEIIIDLSLSIVEREVMGKQKFCKDNLAWEIVLDTNANFSKANISFFILRPLTSQVFPILCGIFFFGFVFSMA